METRTLDESPRKRMRPRLENKLELDEELFAAKLCGEIKLLVLPCKFLRLFIYTSSDLNIPEIKWLLTNSVMLILNIK